MPVRVDGFLVDSDLQQRMPAGWETIPGPLPSGRADLRLDQRSCLAIDGPAAAPCYAGAEAVHGSPPVVYGKAFRTRRGVDLQYWIWYPYNDYGLTSPPREVWQAHEGDWESVSVILDREGRPLEAALSKHCAGTRRAWSDVRRRGGRPIAYVALGSHANYFEPERSATARPVGRGSCGTSCGLCGSWIARAPDGRSGPRSSRSPRFSPRGCASPVPGERPPTCTSRTTRPSPTAQDRAGRRSMTPGVAQ